MSMRQTESSNDPWQIILEGRAILAAGGRLYSKGSNGVPRRLREAFLNLIDKQTPVTLTSKAAQQLPNGVKKVVEHVVPMKRIAIEIIDPDAHDPRTGGKAAVRLGPALDLEHAKDIARSLIVKAYVTNEEHNRLNNTSPSYQWDAPGGDGLARYLLAGVELVNKP